MKENYTFEYIKFFSLIIVLIILAFLKGYYFSVTQSLAMDVMINSMGAFFGVFGIFQLLGYKNFVDVFPKYDPIAKTIPIYGKIYPILSIVIGILYFLNLFSPWRDILVAIITTIAFIGIGIIIYSGKEEQKVHCVCLGNVIKLPISSITVLENLVMSIMSITIIINYFFFSNIYII